MPGGWLEIPGWEKAIGAFISWQETIAIFVVALVLFGPKSIPELARLLAKLIHQLREASAELQRNLYVDDVKDIQRELRDSWHARPERMRTVAPGRNTADSGRSPEPEEDPYPPEEPGAAPGTDQDPAAEKREETAPETDRPADQA